MFLPHPRVKVSIAGSIRDREVACSASDRHGSNFESCVWRTVSSQSFHHPQEVLLAQFSLYVHKGGLKPDSFHFRVPFGPTGMDFYWVRNRAIILFKTVQIDNIYTLRIFCFVNLPLKYLTHLKYINYIFLYSNLEMNAICNLLSSPI